MPIPGYKMIGPDGRESLPFDSDTLASYARQGYVHHNTQIFDPTINQWIPAYQVVALGGAGFAQAPPYSPPVPAYPGQYVATNSGGTTAADQTLRKPLIIGASVLAVVLVGGLIAAIVAMKAVLARTQTITSADQRYALSVPAYWVHNTSRAPGIVEYAMRGTGVFVVHIKNSTSTVGDLERVAEGLERRHASSGLIHGVTNAYVGGHAARQVEFNLTGLNVRANLVSTPDGVYDISYFTKEAWSEQQQPECDKILASFHSVAPAGGAPSAAG